jgi:drug/metabolite transporter (DMT)-like permease
MYVVSKVVLDVIPPFTLLSLRLIMAVLILAAANAAMGGEWPKGRAALRLLAVGMLGFGLSVGMQFVGTRLSTAANSALVTSASPAFIVLFAYLILAEPLTRQRLAALALATVGAVIVALGNTGGSEPAAAISGNLALLVSAVTWALYSVLVKQAAANHAVLAVSLYAIGGGLLVTLAVAPFELATIPIGAITPDVIWGILYLGIASTAIAMYLWNKSLALLDASVVSLLFFAQPVVGALLGRIFLSEPLGPAFYVGGALILAGVALVTWRERRPTWRPEPSVREDFIGS